jgi:hypothetical protein
MRNRIPLTAACLVALIATSSQAALTNLTEITAIGTSGDTLTSISIGPTTYGVLTSPTSFVHNGSAPQTTDWIYTGSTAPADLQEAVGSLDLSKGTLNTNLEAQFGGALQDDSLIFMLVNNDDTSPAESGTIYAIDAAGNRLNGGVGTAINFNSTVITTLVSTKNYNRQSSGNPGAALNRVILGGAFTLDSLGLGGLGATGFELTTSSMDPQEIGIAAVPAPAALPAGLGLLGAMLMGRRRA